MATKKITDLTELSATPASNDVVAIVDIDADVTKKITISNLQSGISSTPFPFTGDAQITGSLIVSGSFASFRVDTDNVILGTSAGANIVNGAENNVIIGTEAASNGTITTTADDNVIMGWRAGYGLTNGKQNIIIGHEAGFLVAGSDFNVFVGSNAGEQTEGQGNIGIGQYAGRGKIGGGATGDMNISIGLYAGYSLGNPDYNILIGREAGYLVGEGSNNIMMGFKAGYNTNGSSAHNNTFLGYSAGYDVTTGDHNILIGSGSVGEAAISNQLRIGHADTILISGSLADGGLKILGQVSASSYIGDGSALTGVSGGTNLTQSLFVSPSGNDGTAVVGDLAKPFSTILGATGSANIGDTIIVYPGTYSSETSNIIKDGVNYYFHAGSIVRPTSTLSQYVVDIGDPTYAVNVRGAGTFISDDTTYGAIRIQAKECYFEFDTAKTTNNTTSTFNQGGTVNLEPTNTDGTYYNPTNQKGNPFYVKGKIVNTGNLGTYAGALVFGRNGINQYALATFEGEVLQLHPTDDRPAVYVRSDLYYYNLHVDARVFASSSNAIKHEGRGTLTLDGGTYSTGKPSSYYAVQADDGFRGNLIFESGDIYGGVKIRFADDQQNILPTAQLKGNIYAQDSPDDYAIYIDQSNVSITGEVFSTVSQNTNARMLFVTSSGAATLSKVYFGGTAIQGNQSYQDFCKIDGHVRLHWAGSFLSDASYVTTEGNIIGSGSYLLIDSMFNPGFKTNSAGSDNYCFTLKDGGTLEIKNKVIWACNQSGEDNGFVNVEGGKLILDGASLINPFFSSSAQDNLGVAIYLNDGSHTGQILNNSFTNLLPFQSGSFTNEITGGGTLFQAPQLFAINDGNF